MQGQRCTAVKVVMVHEAVADRLVAKVHEKVKALTVGKPEDNCDICAVISESSANWIEELVTGMQSVGSAGRSQPTARPVHWQLLGTLQWHARARLRTGGLRLIDPSGHYQVKPLPRAGGGRPSCLGLLLLTPCAVLCW